MGKKGICAKGLTVGVISPVFSQLKIGNLVLSQVSAER